MATIHERVEQKRGCGYRKPGGLYVMGGKLAKACGVLPIELSVCPCCSGGIKQTRSMSFISSQLIESKQCDKLGCGKTCEPFASQKEFGLMWVGTAHYPNASDFRQEAARIGVSKRIPFIPKKLIVGVTWILLAHPKAISHFDPKDEKEPIKFKKGVFSAFLPDRIEYVVKGTETEKELNNMESRGITLVKVIRDVDAQLTLAK